MILPEIIFRRRNTGKSFIVRIEADTDKNILSLLGKHSRQTKSASISFDSLVS